jgi:hypothetical protein
MFFERIHPTIREIGNNLDYSSFVTEKKKGKNVLKQNISWDCIYGKYKDFKIEVEKVFYEDGNYYIDEIKILKILKIGQNTSIKISKSESRYLENKIRRILKQEDERKYKENRDLLNNI